jgi:catalase
MRYRHDGARPVYAPNSYGGPSADTAFAEPAWLVEAGEIGRYAYEAHAGDDDFVQARTLCHEVMSELDRAHLIGNVVDHLRKPELSSDVLLRAVAYWRKVDEEVGAGVARGLGLASDARAA